MVSSEYKIDLSENVRFIIDTLTEHGFEAYAVGGCVRDSILHKRPKDWDITTSARPEQVKALFRRTIDTGIRHGTVTVMLGREGYEVTTYRIDGEYEDGRHPRTVEFSTSLLEDLKRRDFTINAMAYNDTCGLVDEFGGIRDLDNGVIRCVGAAEERFTEDALRMMRAVRFSAQLGFEIEQSTFDAVGRLAPGIAKVSRERIQVEFTKTLLSAHPDYVRKYAQAGILRYILNHVNEILSSEYGEKALQMLCLTEESAAVRYAALLCPLDTGKTEEELRGLKLDNDTVAVAVRLVSVTAGEIPDCEASMRRFMCKHGAAFWPVAGRFMKCYCEAFHEGDEDRLALIKRADVFYAGIMARNECVSLKQLAVNGRDLMENGIERGCRVGEILKGMLEDVLEEPSRNDRAWLLSNLNKY